MANKVCIDNIWYELNKETKEATVTYPDNEEEKYQGEVVIPEIVVYEDISSEFILLCRLSDGGKYRGSQMPEPCT